MALEVAGQRVLLRAAPTRCRMAAVRMAGRHFHDGVVTRCTGHRWRTGMTETAVLSRSGLDQLITVLQGSGYRVIGPTVRDSAIVLAELGSGAELPSGWGVRSAPGSPSQRSPPGATNARASAAAVTGCTGGLTRRCSAIRPGRSPGSSSCIRRVACCGHQTARRSLLHPRRASGTRSWACGPATWPRSRCLARCWAAGHTLMARSPGDGRGCSWSRPGAPSRAGFASARRWAPDRSPVPATTWR